MSRMTHALYLKIADKVYSGEASDVNVPGVPATVWGGSTDTNVVADVPGGARTVNVTALQDWEETDGLCAYLLEHEGETADVVFSHEPGGTAYFKVTATLVAPTLGGAVNAHREFSLTMPCTKPVATTKPVDA